MKRITTFLFAFLITASLTLAAQEPAAKDQTSSDKKVQKAEKKEASAAEKGKAMSLTGWVKDQDGKTVSLDDFAGKWLVVYVYPKDDTPGCTIQGKSFTASKQDFDDANISVVGVSEDDVDSHKSFCNKFGFTIDLLADPNHEFLKAAGVDQSRGRGQGHLGVMSKKHLDPFQPRRLVS